MENFPSVLSSIKDLTKQQIDSLLLKTEKFKSYSEDWQGIPIPFIKTPVITTLFYEPSTRTKHSFIMALNKLRCIHLDFRIEESSMKKGESLKETLINLKSQGVNLAILRSNEENILDQFKNDPPIKIINGGDGSNQHPTQALLDLYTFQQIGLLNKKKFTLSIIGDLRHSRVVNSLIDLLPLYNIKLILCGPKKFWPSEDFLKKYKNITLTENRDEAIDNSDAIYLLRIQNERHNKKVDSEFKENYIKNYGLNFKEHHNIKKPIFHPGPVNIGVEIDEDLMKTNLYFGHQQVRNSVFMRMAIINMILSNKDKISNNKLYKTLKDIT